MSDNIVRGQQTYEHKRKLDTTIDVSKLALEKAGIIVKAKELVEEKKKLEQERMQNALTKIMAVNEIQSQMKPLYELAGKLHLQQMLLDAKLVANDNLPDLPKLPPQEQPATAETPAAEPSMPPAGTPADAGGAGLPPELMGMMPPQGMPPQGLPPELMGMAPQGMPPELMGMMPPQGMPQGMMPPPGF